jgi:hypothetical protein
MASRRFWLPFPPQVSSTRAAFKSSPRHGCWRSV